MKLLVVLWFWLIGDSAERARRPLWRRVPSYGGLFDDPEPRKTSW